MIRLDLHTHSEASADGGIGPEEFADILQNETLDLVAITDHNRIDFALGMQKALGEKLIIVGEEITAQECEIIGLYLSSVIEPGMSASDTIDAIKAQNGLVYIPHPFEKVRKGIQLELLNKLKDKIDIIEVNNGRTLSTKHSVSAQSWSIKNKIASVSSSDAHGKAGIGRTYTILEERPTRVSLLADLTNATHVYARPPLRSYLYPKINRFKKMIRGQG